MISMLQFPGAAGSTEGFRVPQEAARDTIDALRALGYQSAISGALAMYYRAPLELSPRAPEICIYVLTDDDLSGLGLIVLLRDRHFTTTTRPTMCSPIATAIPTPHVPARQRAVYACPTRSLGTSPRTSTRNTTSRSPDSPTPPSTTSSTSSSLRGQRARRDRRRSGCIRSWSTGRRGSWSTGIHRPARAPSLPREQPGSPCVLGRFRGDAEPGCNC
ncbi:hypothetical protein K523DRAFT_137673 [Schizophyllum commune Tattone D]|nr:hypothetical protein K523DRAFT_137673 [Schizophyllum commune Tattone D]